jgi:hypothetical protein
MNRYNVFRKGKRGEIKLQNNIKSALVGKPSQYKRELDYFYSNRSFLTD